MIRLSRSVRLKPVDSISPKQQPVWLCIHVEFRIQAGMHNMCVSFSKILPCCSKNSQCAAVSPGFQSGPVIAVIYSI